MKLKSVPQPIHALVLLAALLVSSHRSSGQLTNWIAYNDHRPSATPVASGWAKTGTNVSGYNMGAPADLTPSPLTNHFNGAPLAATVSFTRTGAPDDFGTTGRPLATNTPMAHLFYGICDLSNDGLVGVRAVPPNTAESYVVMTFGGLDPSKRYVFRGSVARNGGYGTRWSVASISAAGWTDAHINGNGGPGVLTVNNFPSSALNQGQAAWNSGANNEGAVVGWNDIAPFPDGTFSITNQQYTGAIPGGTANGPYGYSFGALMLAEVEVVAPTIVSSPSATVTVEQNRPLTLAVSATGAPLNYQWYKQGLGAIPGATFATYSVPQAQVSDSGTYYVVVYNSLDSKTSAPPSQVTVFADTTAPTVESIFSFPTVDYFGVATMDQIIIEFSEPVTAASVGSTANYIVPGGGNPVSVIVTNERSVVLKLSSPLAENTDYSVTLNGAADIAGNVAGSSSAPFHSWVSGIGNGLLMESYNVEDPSLDPDTVLADPDYPNNPFRRDTLRAFDSRLVFPDDTQEGYGSRIRGLFIPPVSGDWRFFARMPIFGVVYINPNGMDEAGKEEILRQSTQNAPYNWDRLQSSLVSLRAGHAYYFEGLYKAPTGADYFKVAARLAGYGTPTPVDTADTLAPDTNSLAGGFIAAPLAPRDLGGALTIVQDLQNISVQENHFATFAPQVGNPSGLPLSFQWFSNSVAISGATGPSYSFQVTSDSSGTFSVQIAKIGSVTNSRTATLTVVPDTTGPAVVSASSSYTNLTTVVVRFNEIMEPTLVQEPGNYQIDNNSVLQATLDANGSSVTLVLQTALTQGTSYQIQMFDLQDLAANTIVPNPAVVTFVAGADQPGGGQPTLRQSYANGTLTLSWDAPARLQFATSLNSPIDWRDVDTGGATTFAVVLSNEFTVNLDPIQEANPPAGRTGTGSGAITLSNNVLLVDVVYSGMSGNRNNDHFHAPAARGANASPAYDLAAISTGTTSGTIKGSVPLVNGQYGGKTIAAQVDDMRKSLWYLNVHSTTFPGGEIRGQVEAGQRYYRLISP